MHTEAIRQRSVIILSKRWFFIVWISHIDSGQSDQPRQGRRLWGKFWWKSLDCKFHEGMDGICHVYFMCLQYLAHRRCSISICLLIDGKGVLSGPAAKTPFLTQLVAITQVSSKGLRPEARLPWVTKRPAERGWGCEWKAYQWTLSPWGTWAECEGLSHRNVWTKVKLGHNITRVCEEVVGGKASRKWKKREQREEKQAWSMAGTQWLLFNK